jgi:hypothetical protein
MQQMKGQCKETADGFELLSGGGRGKLDNWLEGESESQLEVDMI